VVCRVTLITEWQLEFVQLRKLIRFRTVHTVRLKGYHVCGWCRGRGQMAVL